MLELLIYFLVIAPFLMSEKEKEIFVKVLIVAAVFFCVVLLFYE